MARSNTASTSNWFANATAPVTALPCTLACWFFPANLTQTMNLVYVGNAGVSNYAVIVFNGANSYAGGDNAIVADQGTTAFAVSSAAVASANTWNHACGVFTSATSRAAYLNGGNVGTNAVSRSPSLWDHANVGAARSTTTTFSPLNGSIAEAAFWSVALDAAEVAALATGLSPRLIRPGSLVAYWAMIGQFSPELDFGNNGLYPLTMNGTMAQADHCRVIYPRRPRVVSVAVSTGIAFDAVSNSGYQAAASTYNWNHTCAGTNRFLAVDVSLLSAGQTVLSITYNGVPLLPIGAQSTVTSFGRVESWGLANPASGSNSIVVTLSGSIASAAGAVSYANVHRISPTANYNSAQATNVGAADATVNITTATIGSWVHAAVATSDATITAGNTTRNNVTGAGGSGADEDTNGLVAPGTTAMSYTNVGALATWAIGGYELRPDTSISLFGRLVNVNQSVMNSVSF